jgi:HNH endonuclease
MSRTNISTVGQVARTEDGGLFYSVFISETRRTVWLEVLANTENWPILGPVPQKPEYDPPRFKRPGTPERAEWKAQYDAARKQWEEASAAYKQALHSDVSYQDAASKFTTEQKNQPQLLGTALEYFWKNVWSTAFGHKAPKGATAFLAYRDKILRVESTDPEVFFINGNQFWITAAGFALVKQYVLRREKHYQKVQREIEAFENMEKLEGVSREPIPDAVRLFVWQRDQGSSVKCCSQERLEFDHIIPVAAGGSNTERNIQLLCQPCNRSKGTTI